MSLQEIDLTDASIIQNPNLLNKWCKANSTGKNQSEMSVKAHRHFKGKIPENKMYSIIEAKYKDQNQRKNASKRIAVKSMDTQILEITKQLPKSKKSKLLSYIKNSLVEQAKDMKQNGEEVESYIG